MPHSHAGLLETSQDVDVVSEYDEVVRNDPARAVTSAVRIGEAQCDTVDLTTERLGLVSDSRKRSFVLNERIS